MKIIAGVLVLVACSCLLAAQQGRQTHPSVGNAQIVIWNSTPQPVTFYMSGDGGKTWSATSLKGDEIEPFKDQTAIRISTTDDKGNVLVTKRYQLKFNNRYAIAINESENAYDVYLNNHN